MNKDIPPMIRTPESIRLWLDLSAQKLSSTAIRSTQRDIPNGIVSRSVSEGLFGTPPVENKEPEDVSTNSPPDAPLL